MRVLVTGGAGFIGSHVVQAYLEAGHEVAIVDNLSSGKLSNIDTARVSFHASDILDSGGLTKVFESFGPDTVNHHAAQVSVPKSVLSPGYDLQVNIAGTVKLLEASLRHNVTRFIYASSGGAIYGDARQRPTPEDYPPDPMSPYGVSKLAAEQYVRLFSANSRDFNTVILRYSNVYGPRQAVSGEGGVVAKFCDSILRTEPCSIDGDGLQTRDFVYVGDVASANLDASTIVGKNLTINIGTGIETSILQLFTTLQQISGKSILDPHFNKLRIGDVKHSALNTQRAEHALGWTPRTSLLEGLRATYLAISSTGPRG